MTSRQRLLSAVKLQRTDRVPISTYELCGYNTRAFENNQTSYKPLMDFIRHNTDCVCMWEQRSDYTLAHSAYPVDIASAEVRGANYAETRQTLRAPGGILTSTRRVYDDVNTVWGTERWCKSTQDVDAYMSIPFEPVTYDDGDYARIQGEVGERGIIMSSVGDPACLAMEMMEFGEATVWAMTETAHYVKTLEELHRRNMINLERMLQRRTVDLYRICGPEYITPPYLPPAFFERFVTPYITDMTALIHRYGGLVRIHSHGRIAKVLDGILCCGADALDPCEAPPDGDITLGALKSHVSGKMCLFGNLQLKLLEHGSENDVRETVKRCMDEAKRGGGYVIMPTAAPINIPLAAKTEANYRTFIETALEYGAY